VTEAERKRITRDLHDGVLQDFSYTTAAIGMMVLQAKDAKLREQLQAAVEAVRRGAQGLREVVNDLRLEDEEDRPFPEIVGALVRRSQTMAQRVEISLEVGEQVPSAPLGETGTQVLRIVRSPPSKRTEKAMPFANPSSIQIVARTPRRAERGDPVWHCLYSIGYVTLKRQDI
jgi:nitrate/nitrite-specific signal transduction histidine kinase